MSAAGGEGKLTGGSSYRFIGTPEAHTFWFHAQCAQQILSKVLLFLCSITFENITNHLREKRNSFVKKKRFLNYIAYTLVLLPW